MRSKTIFEAIKSRRSVFPAEFSAEEITKAEIDTLLDAARWAPTHRLTQPWRFKVVRGESLSHLADIMCSAYRQAIPTHLQTEAKLQSIPKKFDQSSAVLLVGMQRDPEERIPEWEEVAAVSMAVQNIWLCASELDIGMYWSSPAYAKAEYLSEFCDFGPGESCLGLLYMGKAELPQREGKRLELSEFTTWC